jgi:hypothetical protein
MIYDLRFGLKLHLLSTKSQSQTHPKATMAFGKIIVCFLKKKIRK